MDDHIHILEIAGSSVHLFLVVEFEIYSVTLSFMEIERCIPILRQLSVLGLSPLISCSKLISVCFLNQ